MRLENLFPLGLLLVIAGFIMFVAGSLSSAGTSTGVVIFIGPVPIVFGSGAYGPQLALISLIAAAIMVFLGYLWTRGWKASRDEGHDPGSH